MRKAKLYKFRERLRTPKEIAEILNVSVVTVNRNIKRAKDKKLPITDKILDRPLSKKRKIKFQNRLLKVTEIAEILGVHPNTIYKRLLADNWKITKKTFQPAWHDKRLKSDSGTLLTEIAFKNNLPYRTVQNRFYSGHTNDAVLGAKTYNYNKEYGHFETQEKA